MKQGARLLICGGRDYDDASYFETVMGGILKNAGWFDAVVEGGARGVDRMAREWAERHGICVITFNANWKKWGKAAGHMRNRAMLDKGKPDIVIAFPGGRGTAGMVDYARSKGVEVIEIT